MDLLRFALVGNYKKFYNDLQGIGKKNKKSPLIMFVDTAISTVLFGSGLQDYLNYRFYEKSYLVRSKYATIGYQAKVYKKAAKIEYSSFFSNKINFNKNFQKYTKRNFYDYEEGKENLREFLNKNKEFIIKPIIGLGGTKVEKIQANKIKDIDKFYDKLKNERLFLEQFIIQNKEWGKISPNSVNTIRVMTSAINGKSEVFFAAARIGNGKVIVDNFHSGGMGVLIDLEKGILLGNGINKKLEEFEYHEQTKIKFNGYKIPYWQEILEITKEAALINDKVNIVGWDVAITDKGPVIIEGNRGPGWDLVQVLLKKGTKYMLEDIKKQMKKEGVWK